MENSVYRSVGRNIARYRKAKKLSQSQLAEKSGISLKYIQNLEGRNPRKATLETLKKIADAVGIEYSRLFKF
jgi:transcriptional regulator with XRE-family HTH domain